MGDWVVVLADMPMRAQASGVPLKEGGRVVLSAEGRFFL